MSIICGKNLFFLTSKLLFYFHNHSFYLSYYNDGPGHDSGRRISFLLEYQRVKRGTSFQSEYSIPSDRRLCAPTTCSLPGDPSFVFCSDSAEYPDHRACHRWDKRRTIAVTAIAVHQTIARSIVTRVRDRWLYLPGVLYPEWL